jgi:hypothetical protein
MGQFMQRKLAKVWYQSLAAGVLQRYSPASVWRSACLFGCGKRLICASASLIVSELNILKTQEAALALSHATPRHRTVPYGTAWYYGAGTSGGVSAASYGSLVSADHLYE